MNGPGPLDIIYAGLAAIGFLVVVCIAGVAFEPAYRDLREDIIDFVRQRFRWYVKDRRHDKLRPSWRPRDTSHLGRAWRERR